MGGNCLLPWKKVTLPKRFGGLGIMDLQLQNQALLLKWLWVANSDTNSLLATTLASICTILPLNQHSIPQGTSSFFIQDLLKLMPIWNATMSVDSDGRFTWNLTSTHQFTAKSAYKFLNDPGIPTPVHHKVWTLHLPLHIKFFLWITLHNRLNTTDNLQRKGWPTISSCIMCDSTFGETADHLLVSCKTASDLHVSNTSGIPNPRYTNADSVRASWGQGVSTRRSSQMGGSRLGAMERMQQTHLPR
jgi:zinc-binding in reverse transcriptase